MGYTFRLQSTDGWMLNDGGLRVSVGETADYILSIKKDSTMKLSDYVADFIADLGIKHIFAVSGGGAMHLVDSVGKHERLTYVAVHHEQAAAMAAESYARLNGIGCCLVTTGPGGTNALTGVACAWIDSIPVVFISGQVTRDTLLEGTGVRQFGVQESDIVTLVRPITKYAVTVKDEKDIRYELEKAYYIAKSGRPGPVWVDIPLDVQSKQIKPTALKGYEKPFSFARQCVLGGYVTHASPAADVAISMLRAAQRPVLIVGNGVRLAGAESQIRGLVAALGIPVISSWTAADMVADLPYHIGHMGIFGDRASNFAVQNADLLLVIGCRLSVPMIGYNFAKFAREAKIIMVDVDEAEIKKPSLRVDLPIVADAKKFVGVMLDALSTFPQTPDGYGWLVGENGFVVNRVFPWLCRCQEWALKYPAVLPEYAGQKGGVNSYHFINALCDKLPDDAVVVLDVGTAFTCTYQAAKMKHGQRWVSAAGHSPMGYGLPGAIGAHYATGKRVVCIVGDGALQFNIQELSTIAHNNLPITIFVLNNGGYLTIKLMQQNHFGRMVGSEKDSGVSFPDLCAISEAYGMDYWYINGQQGLDRMIDVVFGFPGAVICEIIMPDNQPLIPRVSSLKRPDGSIASKPLEDMFPFLDREEFKANMIVKTTGVLG